MRKLQDCSSESSLIKPTERRKEPGIIDRARESGGNRTEITYIRPLAYNRAASPLEHTS